MPDSDWFWEICRQARLTSAQGWALLYHCAGYDAHEIGVLMHLSEGSARGLVRRAQANLRRHGPYILLTHAGTYEALITRLRREARDLLECLENRDQYARAPGARQYDTQGNPVARPARVVTADDLVEGRLRELFGEESFACGRPDPEKHAGGWG